MLRNVCRVVLLVWAAGAVIRGLTTGRYEMVAVGAIVIYTLF